MMDFLNNKELIMFLFIIVIIAINWALFSAFRRSQTGNSINILKNSFEVAKSPFKKEYQQMDELSKRIKELEGKNPTSQIEQQEENE